MVRAALLALLLALSLPLGAAAAPTGGAGPGTGMPSLQDVAILTLNGSARSSFATAGPDLSTAMAVQRSAAASRLHRYALAEQIERAPSTEARQLLLSAAATDVEIRIASLREDARALRVAYAAREIDPATFLTRMARLHARAGELRTTLDRIQAHAEEIPQFPLSGRVQLLDSRLIGYDGPVRERALSAALGEAPVTRIAVTASADGVVLSMLDGSRFVREAYRGDQRTPGTINRFTVDAAFARASELYPVAYNKSQRVGFGQSIDGTLGGNLYLVQLWFPAGSINAYLDDGTRNVFYEIQKRRVDLLDPRPSVVGAANGTRLIVNRSYAGGPLQLSVVDNATGAPLQTTVVVGGHAVQTASDGSAWTLAPAAPFQVTAVGPRGNVTVSVRPFAPTPVIGEG